jgi:hypothetical protein
MTAALEETRGDDKALIEATVPRRSAPMAAPKISAGRAGAHSCAQDERDAPLPDSQAKEFLVAELRVRWAELRVRNGMALPARSRAYHLLPQ